MSMIPSILSKSINERFRSLGIESGGINDFTGVAGGCINDTGIIHFDQRNYFVKWNSRKRFPEMFKKEAKALEMLGEACPLKIPKPIFYGDEADYSYLVMEWIESRGRVEHYWETLGQGLAELHRTKSERFGFEEDNFIGSLEQSNTWNTNWLEFFFENRVRIPLEMAIDGGIMDPSDLKYLERLKDEIGNLFPEGEKPALIHGDLWGGNIMSDSLGAPCIIDPAIYFANREIEIAFTTLFGRFGEDFYSAYNESFPMELGFEKRIELYNLYPLLVHANLFGGGYVNSCRQILKRYS